MDFVRYVQRSAGTLAGLALEHLILVLVPLTIGSVIGVALGVLIYRRANLRSSVLGVTGFFLTIPSLSLYALMLPLGFSLGNGAVVAALVLYSLLPVVRNTLAGLVGVDQAIVESAAGMGMTARQRLRRIELPLAWPVIVTGIRVSGLVLVGIAALGAIVNGGGLGGEIFRGLRLVTSPNGLNIALAGTLAIVLLGLVLDVVFQVLMRLTTPRGIR